MPIGNAFAILKSVKVKVPMIETYVNINQPEGMAFDSNGNLFVTCSGGSWINKIDTNGAMTTFAQIISGTEVIKSPKIAIDRLDNIYTIDETTIIADGLIKYHFNIYKINNLGQMSMYYYQTGKTTGICVDKSDNLYVSNSTQLIKFDSAKNRTLNFGKVRTSESAYGLALDSKEDIYFCDIKNHIVNKITKNGETNTFYTGGFVVGPSSICFDEFDNSYIVDGNSIKKRTPGNITTIAGNTTSAGDKIGVASSSRFNAIYNVVYKNGEVYISDRNNNKIKKLIL